LISTFSLLNRQTDLHVYGPKGIKEVTLLQLKLSSSWTSYNLYFHELTNKEPEVIFEDDKVVVSTIPLKHRVYTNGFLFQEKTGDRKLNPDAVNQYGIETCYYNKIKSGSDMTLEDGRVIPNELLTFDPYPAKSYAFCSDTMYDETIVSLIRDVDVLYHESTFLESEAHLCQQTMHTTAKQAAEIALKANAKQLVLGHYSTRYGSIEPFKEEAETVFANVHLADDGKVFEFN
jgi:ribonuclease Z